MIHHATLFLTMAFMAAILALFLFVAWSARKPIADYAPTQKRILGVRTALFWVALAAGVVITALTTLDLPYAATRGQVASGAVEVNVRAHQWFWELSRDRAKAGDTVVFRVSTNDVNHGLGIYDPDMRLVGQTQAMPGYVNSLEIAFDAPGNYKLLCMEYCGLGHHAMISEFIITPR